MRSIDEEAEIREFSFSTRSCDQPYQKQSYPFMRQFEKAEVYKKKEHWLSSTHRRDHEVYRPHCARALPCCFLSVAYPSFRCDCEDIPS